MMTEIDLAVKNHINTVALLARGVTAHQVRQLQSALADVPGMMVEAGANPALIAALAPHVRRHADLTVAFLAFREAIEVIWPADADIATEEVVAAIAEATATGMTEEDL